MVTERCIRVICTVSSENMPRERSINLALQVAVIEHTQHMDLFADDISHSCHIGAIDTHVVNIIRLVVNEYTRVRFYSIGKSLTEKLHGKNLRFKSNKHVPFAHQ